METDMEVTRPRQAAFRLLLASAGTLVLLLVIMAFLRPDMMMGAFHHMEAMIGMEASTTP